MMVSNEEDTVLVDVSIVWVTRPMVEVPQDMTCRRGVSTKEAVCVVRGGGEGLIRPLRCFRRVRSPEDRAV